MYQAAEIIIPLGGMAMIFGIVYLSITSHHRKEMAMIEAGMNPNKTKSGGHSKMRTALLLMLVPLGILTGNIVAPFIHSLDHSETALLFGFLFGGVALISAYFLERKFEVTNED